MKRCSCHLLALLLLFAWLPSGVSAQIVEKGDLNGDGSVDVRDAIRLKAYLIGQAPLSLDAELGDINGDGRIDRDDVSALLARAAARPAGATTGPLGSFVVRVDPETGALSMTDEPGRAAKTQLINGSFEVVEVKCLDCNRKQAGAHTIDTKLRVKASMCLADVKVANPRCVDNCTLTKVTTTPDPLPEVLVEGEMFTVRVEVNVQEVKPFQVRFDMDGKVVMITLEVEASDVATSFKIPSVLPAANKPKDHFVTPQGTGNMILQAKPAPDTPAVRAALTWDGANQDAADRLKATVPRTAALKEPVAVKLKGKTCKEAMAWVVFSTPTLTHAAGPTGSEASIRNADGTRGLGIAIDVTWSFSFEIMPAEIITDADRPRLNGAGNNATVPDGAERHIASNRELRNGVNRRWDESRQLRLKILTPGKLAKADLVAVPGALYDNLNGIKTEDTPVDFPAAGSAKGNDDSGPNDEDNDPYTDPDKGKLIGSDVPNGLIRHSVGKVGDTYEERVHFKEFARLELDGHWLLISDPDAGRWRFHFKVKKVASHEATTGPDGINNTDTAGDDITLIPKGNGQPVTAAIVAVGAFNATPLGGDDVLVRNAAGVILGIHTGNDGIAQTAAAGDDVQLIPVGRGAPNRISIRPGPNGVLNSVVAGDDTRQNIEVWADDGSSTASDNNGF